MPERGIGLQLQFCVLNVVKSCESFDCLMQRWFAVDLLVVAADNLKLLQFLLTLAASFVLSHTSCDFAHSVLGIVSNCCRSGMLSPGILSKKKQAVNTSFFSTLKHRSIIEIKTETGGRSIIV